MTYAEDIEELAHALAQILACQDGVDRDDTPFVLAARDAVVKRLRALSGAVINAGPAHQEFPARHIAADPAHALHAALRDLGLASEPDRPATIDVLAHSGRSGGLPHWQAAARASALLELYDEPLRLLPGPAAWAAARDIADLSATLPHIDADLARHLPPGATRAPVTLTDVGTHGAIRIAASELLTRTTHFAGLTLDIAPSTPARAIRVQSMAALPEGIRCLTAMVNARGGELTATEARAVAKALAEAVEVGARTLGAAARVDQRLAVAASGLERAARSVRRIYVEPMETLTPRAPAVSRLADEIRHHLRVLEALVDRVDTFDDERERDEALARVAAPALEVAKEIPGAAAALDMALHASHDARQLLSPVEYQHDVLTPGYLWVRAQAPVGQAEPLALAASSAARAALAAIAPLIESATAPGSLGSRRNNVNGAARALGRVQVAVEERGRPKAASPAPDHPRVRVGSQRGHELAVDAKQQNEIRRRRRR